MSSESPRLAIQPEWLIPVIPRNQVLTSHALIVGDTRIIALLPVAERIARYPDIDVLDLPGQAVIPGLVNAHGHGAMTLLRGYADDKELMDWLNNYMWPVEAQFVDRDFVRDGTTLAIAEMLRSGTTCAADTYFFPDVQAETYRDNHFRAQCCLPVIQFANAWASSEDEHIHKALQVHDDFRHEPLITTAFAPHAPYTVTDAAFERIAVLSEQLQLPIHLHLHETRTEVSDGLRDHGKRPFQRMMDLGLMSPLLQTVHMTQLETHEIATLAEQGAHVVHCPESNMKLASGFCPVDELLEADVNVAIGTDGAASNNNLDMLEELRTAALIAKGNNLDATSLGAHQVLELATLGGARFLGLEESIGSLEPGKAADITAIDLNGISFQPVYHPVSQLVYTATGHQVSNVWINGRHLLSNGDYTELDLAGLRRRVNRWAVQIGATLSE